MKQYSEKEYAAATKAMTTFMCVANGKQPDTEAYAGLTRKALERGAGFDILLNAANYARAAAAKGSAPSAQEYVDAILERNIEILPLTKEPAWDDGMAVKTLTECFHDWYSEINPTPGAYRSAQARTLLCAAASAFGLDGIMRQGLVEEYLQQADHSPNCMSYLKWLTRAAESDTIPVSTDGRDGEDGISGDDESPEDMPVPPADALTFLSMPSPREYKRNTICEAINELPLSSVARLMEVFDPEISFEEFVSALTNGDIDAGKEMADAREAHQAINGALYDAYMSCARWQGVEISADTARTLDLLRENWDLRDESTRKLQKLKELIFKASAENAIDTDMIAVIADLESYYNKKEEE